MGWEALVKWRNFLLVFGKGLLKTPNETLKCLLNDQININNFYIGRLISNFFPPSLSYVAAGCNFMSPFQKVSNIASFKPVWKSVGGCIDVYLCTTNI